MNISRVIREQRNKLSLSQEELGERIYVTRQTISNWENDKSYPDIHSLILLSSVFGMTIDNLVKGDLEIMEQKIEGHDVASMCRYSKLMNVGYAVFLILIPVSVYLWLEGMAIAAIAGIAVSTVAWILTFYFALKTDQIKKKYDIQTYREIVAFSKGETLDEITRIRESGKRKYQKFLILVGFGIVCLIIFFIIWGILSVIL